MIAVSCLLLGIGLADLVRSRSARFTVFTVAQVVGTATVAGLQLLFGIDPPIVVLSAAVLIGWMLGTGHPSFSVRKVAVVIIGVVVAAALLVSPTYSIPLPVLQWYGGLGYAALASVPFSQALACVALVVFLIESANIVVRTVLELPDGEEAPRTVRGKLGARRPAPAPLKGGRIIGPLERIFLFALALAGQFTAIGAIVAAKGIVRFPELSRDTSRGSNAELFLVGSFSSWALVLGAVLYAKLGA